MWVCPTADKNTVWVIAQNRDYRRRGINLATRRNQRQNCFRYRHLSRGRFISSPGNPNHVLAFAQIGENGKQI